jgi:Spy/CpxP family protein refolding chaperone
MKKLMLLVVPLALGLLLAVSAVAHGMGEGRGPHMKEHLDTRVEAAIQSVHANDAQAKLLRAVKDDVIAQFEAMHADHEATLAQVQTAWLADAPDVKALQTHLDEKGDELRTRGHALIHDVVALHATLTPTQRTALVKEFEPGMGERALGFVGRHKGLGDKGHEMMQERMRAHLDDALAEVKVTPEQKDRVHAILDELLPALKPDFARLGALPQALRTQFVNDTIDEKALDEVVDTQAATLKTTVEKALDAGVKLHATLSTEQRAALWTRVEAMREKMREHRGEHGGERMHDEAGLKR